MASSESSKTVFLAMSVNFSIGVAKSIIATITMSSAMFSEAVHSFVDTGNQFLLWFGIKQAKKSNPKIYPLGRGREEYFWTLVVAVLIFTIGGLVSLEHGIESLSHPKKLENLSISLTLLIVSIILESYVLKKAIKRMYCFIWTLMVAIIDFATPIEKLTDIAKKQFLKIHLMPFENHLTKSWYPPTRSLSIKI